MTKKELKADEQFQLLIENLVNQWQRRKDIKFKWFNKEIEFKNNGKIPVQVQDVIDALWKNDKLKPLIMDWDFNKAKQKYEFKVHLPGGIKYTDFESKEEYFKDATHSTVKISRGRGNAIAILTVAKVDIPKIIPYSFGWQRQINGKYLAIPIGINVLTGELVMVDLVELPHLMVAGLARHGKSNLLHVIAVSLLHLNNVYLCVIDLKRGSEFGYLEKAGSYVAKSEEQATELLTKLYNLMIQRYELMAKLGIVKIQEYEGKNMPYIVLIADEIARIQNKACHQYLIDIIQMGSAAGIHIIGATQRPSHTVFKGSSFSDFRSQFGATCCYHVSKRNDSQVALGSDKGILIPKIPGRCLLDIGDEEIHIQSMALPVTDMTRKELVKKSKGKLKKEDIPTAKELVDKLVGNGVIIDDEPFVWKQAEWDKLQQSQQLTVSKQRYTL